jgi:hypothetical protein
LTAKANRAKTPAKASSAIAEKKISKNRFETVMN